MKRLHGVALSVPSTIAFFLGGDGLGALLLHPPKSEQSFINGVPLVWGVGTSWYGEVMAGAIWNRTFINECKSNRRNFCQSEFDPGHIYKIYPDGGRCDIALYVDDGFATYTRNCSTTKADYDSLTA